jgi:hypothetical protein
MFDEGDSLARIHPDVNVEGSPANDLVAAPTTHAFESVIDLDVAVVNGTG